MNVSLGVNEENVLAKEFSVRAGLGEKLEDFAVQKMVHSLAVDTATHRVYAPEQQENGQPVARMVVYQAIGARKH
jgi:hypothetical protein